MANRQLDEEAIFHIARQIDKASVRSDYLQQVCGDNTALLARVEALLEVHEQEGDFLQSAASEPSPTVDAEPISERPGTEIGRYRLMEQIGEGGMGVVFVAEQRKPLKRKVALKVIKPGMDSKAVVARFEAERQVLALMDHPNIAHVLDADTTDAGRPYFVMEYVRGIPITEYCDQNKLTIHERLDLFIQVCHAIQHAHQKGIVHRDIKPSNVLVTLHDGNPVPKVIDFGVAKALNTRLTDKTIYTAHLQVIGTLMYMSPEQAELSGLDVDTRSDIYSLGVLLYELLTGTTPFQKDDLDQAGFDEQRRMIREQDPPRASLRISSLGETATTIAAQRKTDSKKLHQQLRGDLDWIVMKALEKDRTRRYETANGLADDVTRYLDQEPISAHPPSALYRVGKLASRNRVAVIATGIVLFALIVGSTVSACLAVVAHRQAIIANEESDRVRQLASELQLVVNSLQTELTDRAMNAAVSGDFLETQEAIEKARLAEAPTDLLQTLHGLALFYSGRPEEAIQDLENAVATNQKSLSALSALYWAYKYSGRYGDSARVGQQIAELQMVPRTDYERLFQAHADLTSSSKPEVIETLSALIEKHRYWVIAYAVRSRLWSDQALDTKEMQDIQNAVDDADRAAMLSPDNPFVLTVGLLAHNRAIQLSESLGRDASQQRANAAVLAAELGQWPNFVLAREERATFYRLSGQLDLEKEEEEALIANRRPWGNHLAVLLERKGAVDSEELDRFSEQGIDWQVRIFRAYVLALDCDDEVSESMEIFHNLVSENIPYEAVSITLDIPLLCGNIEAAQEASAALLERDLPPTVWSWWQHRARYLAGDESEKDFLERAQPFLGTKGVAHYTVGLKALAEGNRAKAEEHFREVAKTGKPTWWCYRWAKALLAQMERHPHWPEEPPEPAEPQSS